jgi:hypothetical protein
MGYEAQIASVNDAIPGRRLNNAVVRKIKQRSMSELMARRQQIITVLKDEGCAIDLVNGGGSLKATALDSSVTEVTAGSAFFAPGLFQHFHDVRFQPAAFFALQVVRVPAPRMITCQGGGYVASGRIGTDKQPRPVMPPGLGYIGIEGAGEVQTPLRLPADAPPLAIGDPVFFQHAKAGELCERFNHLLLIEAGKHYTRQTYPRNDLDGTAQLYWSGGLELGTDARLVFLRPKVVGGGSVVNQALVDRFDTDAFDGWRRDSGTDGTLV